MPQKILKIGHRGACGYEPENTLASFKKALDLNVDAIELDVHCCKTGELVVIHDDTLDKTTNGQGFVADKTLAELKQLDAGKGEKIPALSEVLDFVDKRVIINIELKGKNTAKPVSDLIDLYILEKGWTADLFLVSSFSRVELLEFKKLNQLIKIGIIFKDMPIGHLKFGQDLRVDFVVPFNELANEQYVAQAHERNLKVFVWTLNNKEDIKRLTEIGVDGIFSNFPDII